MTLEFGDKVYLSAFGRLRVGAVVKVGRKRARIVYALPDGATRETTRTPAESLEAFRRRWVTSCLPALLCTPALQEKLCAAQHRLADAVLHALDSGAL